MCAEYAPPTETPAIFNPADWTPNNSISNLSNYCTLSTSQNLTGFKIFSTAPQMASLLNGTGLTVNTPASAGTLALLTDIPSLSGYVTLAGTQNITGTKNFTDGTGIVQTGVYPRTSASNQASSTFTTPAIQVGGSTNDGIYSSATDIVDIGTQGTNYISLQPQGIYRFVGGTVDPAIVFNQRIQVLNGANVASSPAVQIDNQNSGFYRVSQGVIGIGISGVATGRWSSAGLNLFGVAGSAGAPAIVMANDTTSGFYRPAANQIGISCSGSLIGTWSTSGLTFSGASLIQNALGSVGVPSYSFNGDPNTGIYSSGADTVDIATNGVNRLSLGTSVLDSSVSINTINIRGKGGSSNILNVAPVTNDAVGTVIMRVTPSTGGWSTGGIATIQMGDLNNAISVTNGSAMIIKTPSGVKIGDNGIAQSDVRSGTESVAIGAGIAVGSNVTKAVSFSPAFASTPRVLVTNNGGVSGEDGLNCITTAPSTTGFTIVLRNVGTGTTGTGTETVSWYAWV